MGYVIFVFFVLLFAYLGDAKVSGGNKCVYFRCLLVFTLAYMIGLGGNMSSDHQGYREAFVHISSIKNLGIDSFLTFLLGKYEDVEYGFALISLLIKKIGFSDVGFFFVIALITNSLIVNTYYKFKNPAFIFLIFLSSAFFGQEPNLVRQTLAISIFVYSLPFIVQKDWKKYLICEIVIFLIHHSSIVTIILLPLCFDIKYDIYKTIKIVLLVAWVGSIFVAFGKIVFDLSHLSLFMFRTEGYEGYEAYLTNENRIGTNVINFDIVYNLLVALYFYLGKDKKELNVYAYCFIIGALILNFSVQFVNFYRIGLYFSGISPAFIPQMLFDFVNWNKKTRNYMKLLIWLVVLIYIRVLFISISSNSDYLGKNMESIFDII